MEEKKKGHSVVKDICRQAKDDIIVPKVKDMMANTFSETTYMIGDTFVDIFRKLVYGKDTPPVKGRGTNTTNYSSISRRQAQQTVTQQNIGVRSSTSLQYVVVESEEKARQIQSDLISAIQQYGRVRVADLYEKSERVKPIFTDFNYGWTNPNDVHYIRNRDGYWFNMPEPVKIS